MALHSLNPDDPGDRLVVEYHQSAALDLSLFIDSLWALERLWEVQNPDTRLAIAKLDEGSVLGEFIPYVIATGIPVFAAMNGAVMISDFVEKTGRALKAFGGLPGEPSPIIDSNIDPANLLELIDAMPQDHGSSFAIRHTHRARGQTSKIVVEATIGGGGLESARQNLRFMVERRELVSALPKDETTEYIEMAELHLDQISRDLGKASGRTRDKAIIPVISHRAVPLYFSSGGNLKDQILAATDNPLQTRYTVNVEVKTVGGHPKSYTILGFQAALLLPAPAELKP